MNRWVLFSAVGVLFFMSALGVDRGDDGATPERGVIAQIATTSTCAADEYDCWQEFYASLLSEHGSVVSLSDLKARFEDGSARGFCHEILHRIGRHAFAESGSLGEAFTRGDTFCRSGYHHGVLEGVFTTPGGDSLLMHLDSVCHDIPGRERYSYNYFSCVHGIGHGLMAHFNHDVFAALKGCDNLSREWERESCYGGVYMENIISDTSDQPSQFLKKEDLHYPCNASSPQQQRSCYLMQTSHMLEVLEYDFFAVFAECAAISAPLSGICYESLGRDISGQAVGDAEIAAAYCAYGVDKEARDHCIFGAAVDFIQSDGVDTARDLCDLSEDAARCQSALERHISQQ